MSQKVKISKDTDIYLGSIPECHPIFIIKDGIVSGMVLNEYNKGWICRIGGGRGHNGYYESIELCVQNAMSDGYEVRINIECD